MTEHEHGENCRCDPILNSITAAIGPTPGDRFAESLVGTPITIGSLSGEVTRLRADGMLEITLRGPIPDYWKMSVEHLSIAEGGDDVGFVKHGHGEVLPEPEDNKKTASENWSEQDQQELADENKE